MSIVTRTHYRTEIDGLRAVAIIAVIINHFNKDLLPSGHLGVDVFFVISGFVITGSLYNSSSKSFSDFLLSFYSRRFKRLMPALILFVLAIGILICFFDPEPDVSLKTGFTSLFGLSNLYLLRISADYFASSSKLNVFTHTWSLGVEEQFYFLYPLIIWICGFNRQSKRGNTKFFWVIGLLSTFSLLLFIYLNITNESLAFFLMPTRFWEVGVGCLAFFLSTRITANELLDKIPALAVFILLLATLFMSPTWSVFATIAAASLATILILTIKRDTTAYSILTNPVAVYIGTISYSLYLWHWGVLSISRRTIGINLWTAPFQFVFIIFAAAISYHFVERPIRNKEWSSSKLNTVFIGIGFTAIASVLLFSLLKFNDGRLFLGVNSRKWSIGASEIIPSYKEITDFSKGLIANCNMTPHHLSGDSYRPKPIVDSTFIDRCIKSPEGVNKILLVGDSFAQVSARHLSIIAHNAGYDFRAIMGYNCPYPLPLDMLTSSRNQECKEVDEQLLWNKIVNSLDRGDLLIVRLYLPKKQYLDYKNEELPPQEAYDRSLIELAQTVAEKEALLLVIGSNPTLTLEKQIFSSPQWFHFNRNENYAYIYPSDNQETAYFHLIDSHLIGLFDGIDSAVYFSLKPYLCDAQNVCRIKKGNRLLYSDNVHISPYAHDLFFDDLSLAVEKLILSGSVK